MLIGVAPAMCGDQQRPFRGGGPDECWGEKTRKRMGCDKKGSYSEVAKEIIDKLKPRHTARGVMQAMVMQQGDELHPQAQRFWRNIGNNVTGDSTGDVVPPPPRANHRNSQTSLVTTALNKPNTHVRQREEQGCGSLGENSKT